MFQHQVIWGEMAAILPRKLPEKTSGCDEMGAEYCGARSLGRPQQQGAKLALPKVWCPPCLGTPGRGESTGREGHCSLTAGAWRSSGPKQVLSRRDCHQTGNRDPERGGDLSTVTWPRCHRTGIESVWTRQAQLV